MLVAVRGGGVECRGVILALRTMRETVMKCSEKDVYVICCRDVTVSNALGCGYVVFAQER